jgi:transposase InsO family protein
VTRAVRYVSVGQLLDTTSCRKVTYYVLFTIELATRKVWIGGITTHPDTNWMLQIGRNALDVVDGPLLGKRYLIIDRDVKYCGAFRQMFAREGIEVIRLPPRSPNLNAYAERFVRSVKEECISKIIPIGEGCSDASCSSSG